MLSSALSQYRQQQRISVLGLTHARRISTRGSRVVARTLGAYQASSARLAIDTAPDLLIEQGIDATQTARVLPASVLSGDGAAAFFDKAATSAAFDSIVLALIQDAGRTAAAIDNTTRPAVTGYIRSLNGPTCSRCAVLAGRVYRYSQGFQRHPRCDCLMTPTNEAAGKHLVTNPATAFRNGDVRGLSKGDTEALSLGADMGQVVNVRRKEAGLTIGSSVIERAGRLTPQGILHLATDRARQLTLLRRFGYIT